MQRRKLIIVIAAVSVLVAGILICAVACLPRSSTPAAPVQQTEQSDCDKSDIAEKDVEDCGIGVLLDPGKRTTKPPVKSSPKPKVTRR